MSETYTNNVGRSDYRLPTVSANDNGKVLKVVEGEWKKAEGGGSGGGGTIYLERNLSGEIGASYNDILAYITDGKSVFYSFQGEYSTIILPLIGYSYDSTPGEERCFAFFGGVDPDASDISIATATASTATDTLVVS